MNKWDKVKEEVLLKCKRHCCLCEKHFGAGITVHHIIPRNKGGKDEVDNAIPLCHNCHFTVGHYNPEHPMGNKFKPGELKKRRDNFYRLVEQNNYRNYSRKDVKLLEKFKRDFTKLIEFTIKTDFTAVSVPIEFIDEIDLKIDAWNSYGKRMENAKLEEIKNNIIEEFVKLRSYVNLNYMREMGESACLIIRNQSYDEGEKMKEIFRPQTNKIRKKLNKYIEELYASND